MNKELILQEAKQYDSFYLYEKSQILKRKAELQEKFEGIDFLYSIKCNSYLPVLKTILCNGFGADAASLSEVHYAHKLGISPKDIQYSAPGKREKEIEAALPLCTITADSVNEIDMIHTLAQKKGIVAKIGVRINPDFGFDTQNPAPTKFGIDADTFFKKISFWKEYKNIEITGIHIHLKSQELSAKTISNYYEKVFAFAHKVSQTLEKELDFINFGSGIGICYAPTDTPVDLNFLGSSMSMMAKKYRETSPHTRIIIETGRYLVGEAGTYVSRVLDKKISCGKTFIILHNTLNGFFRSSLANAFEKFYGKEGNPFMYEPLYTKKNAFEIVVLKEEKDKEIVTLMGNLCTATDEIASDISLPKLQVGDLVAFTNAGAYCAALSPMQFSSQEKPVELLL